MLAVQAVLTFLVLNGLAVFVSAVVADAGRDDDRAGGWLLRCLSVYLVLVHSVVLVAGLVGHLPRGGLAILLLAAAMAGALRLTRAPNRHARSPAAGAGFTAVTLFSPLAAIASGIIWTWPHLLEATRLWIWDDYTYTWSIRRCGCASIRSPPRPRPTRSRCRRGIRSRPASSPPGSWRRSRERVATRWPG